jgi:hypothetical protein
MLAAKTQPDEEVVEDMSEEATHDGANHSTDYFIEQITAVWNKQVESIVETGRLLIEAKEQLRHGEFSKMIKEKLPFGERTAQRLMAIANHPVLSKPTHVSVLPPSWGTLYALTDLDVPDEALEELIAAGKINPETERADVDEIKKGLRNEGIYDFSKLRRSLELLIRCKAKWPEPSSELVSEVMQEVEGEDDYVDWRLLGELSAWIATLHKRCEEEEKRDQEQEEQQREKEEAESQPQRKEREVRRLKRTRNKK